MLLSDLQMNCMLFGYSEDVQELRTTFTVLRTVYSSHVSAWTPQEATATKAGLVLLLPQSFQAQGGQQTPYTALAKRSAGVLAAIEGNPSLKYCSL